MSNTPERTSGSDLDGRELARRLYGGPPEADTRDARCYREHLQRRFGAGVPPAVVEAFERAYDIGWDAPDQIEALIAGLRAGVHDRQQYRRGGGESR